MDAGRARGGRASALFVATDKVEILVSAAQSRGTLGLVEVEVMPGSGPPLHIHEREDETFHVLSGEITLWCGNARLLLRAGESGFGPRGTPHRYENRGTEPARMLVAITPGGFEGYFRETGFPALPGMTPPEMTEALVARLLAPAARYGLAFVG